MVNCSKLLSPTLADDPSEASCQASVATPSFISSSAVRYKEFLIWLTFLACTELTRTMAKLILSKSLKKKKCPSNLVSTFP